MLSISKHLWSAKNVHPAKTDDMSPSRQSKSVQVLITKKSMLKCKEVIRSYYSSFCLTKTTAAIKQRRLVLFFSLIATIVKNSNHYKLNQHTDLLSTTAV